MASEGRIKLDMVPATRILGQGLLYIEKEHVLSVLLLKHIGESYIPFYRLTQQPVWMFTPLYLVRSPKNKIIPKICIPTNSERLNRPDVYEAPIMAIPISCVPPKGFVPYSFMNERQLVISQGGGDSIVTGAPEFSYSERKQNWYIRRLARSKGNRSDPYYVHVQSDKQFRSLVDVHKYIIHGLLPNRSKGKVGETKSTTMVSPSNKLRGDKLLNRIPVGHYDLSTNQVYREDYGSAPSRSGNKRKRDYEASGQEGEEVFNGGFQSSQLIYTLYDFEPK